MSRCTWPWWPVGGETSSCLPHRQVEQGHSCLPGWEVYQSATSYGFSLIQCVFYQVRSSYFQTTARCLPSWFQRLAFPHCILMGRAADWWVVRVPNRLMAPPWSQHPPGARTNPEPCPPNKDKSDLVLYFVRFKDIYRFVVKMFRRMGTRSSQWRPVPRDTVQVVHDIPWHFHWTTSSTKTRDWGKQQTPSPGACTRIQSTRHQSSCISTSTPTNTFARYCSGSLGTLLSTG